MMELMVLVNLITELMVNRVDDSTESDDRDDGSGAVESACGTDGDADSVCGIKGTGNSVLVLESKFAGDFVYGIIGAEDCGNEINDAGDFSDGINGAADGTNGA